MIEDVRRAQIIESAIETFAEVGYSGTSLARIAERAGISKGVISYHFAGKDELMEQLVDQVYREITGFVAPRVERESTAAGRLRARLRSVAEYVQGHRSQLLALAEVFNNLRDANDQLRYGETFNEPIYQSQEAMLRAGQDSGELRDFDARVMAVTVQAAIDAMIAYWGAYPEHDIAAHAEQLADLFENGIRAHHAGQETDR
ncbi:HTH-type transcriptional regulator TtgR [Actinoalloteichus hoggarensis]|uniref:HTH-type transcriptional regulator TtgR n=1 Tax=Actinoalloteichus hoggarensis TaxID=1470176 RepID=A0A221W668_9PSEU|nr:HTH-type transcriptional regulator TtgR [Actinoalloteichus hoggarensis]